MPSDVPCSGDAFECRSCPPQYRYDTAMHEEFRAWERRTGSPKVCSVCAKSASNGGKCGGGAKGFGANLSLNLS